MSHNLFVGYTRMGKGTWAYKASSNKPWIIIYTIFILLLLFAAVLVF